MSGRRGSFFVERDRHGRERFVRRRSTSYEDRSSHRDMDEARAQALELEVDSLQTRLSFEQRNVHILEQRLQQLSQDQSQAHHLRQQYQVAKDECSRLDERLYQEEKKTEKYREKYERMKQDYEDLSEKYRLMKRGVSQQDHDNEFYRVLYEEKLQEVELLRMRGQEKDELHHLDQQRIEEKNQTIKIKNRDISYYQEYLRSHGFRVDT
ncbi:hypothetical protein GLAREA_02523 [Glarea lozoyensis ATCC 20868]|uniref:Uncharacterized protein n=1 Tax=Glarea lozoyensis (strain ATCC 20868 / MF5171) TaxID=1116229 RepID=S3CLI9_GLAL2|nr:uncharacterized protein GLAREA_02523 [Glarea lozoyensis ATCC 20868]EPE26610.1 hypothetical protein GLAREA_02523 [Glarea lozoyensis ATCC 20868]